jgi:allophanate hydrolase
MPLASRGRASRWSSGRLANAIFGRFVAGVPAPMGIGKVKLESGAVVPGFLCEAFALEGGEDITALGGWRAYLGRLAASV